MSFLYVNICRPNYFCTGLWYSASSQRFIAFHTTAPVFVCVDSNRSLDLTSIAIKMCVLLNFVRSFPFRSQFSLGFRLLLTGTPIQNNLQEVYSLLTFIQPDIFPPDATTEFVNAYADVQTQSSQGITPSSKHCLSFKRKKKRKTADEFPIIASYR